MNLSWLLFVVALLVGAGGVNIGIALMQAFRELDAGRTSAYFSTQTSPRNYPGSRSQRKPKSPKGDNIVSANL
jgi:hypothetical protein